jgi:hypothetical protein
MEQLTAASSFAGELHEYVKRLLIIGGIVQEFASLKKDNSTSLVG